MRHPIILGAIALTLAFNASAALAGSHGGGKKDMKGLVACMKDLPEDKRKALMEKKEKAHETMKEIKDRIYAEKKKQAEVLGAETFDREKFLSLGENIVELKQKLYTEHMKMKADMAEALPMEMREKMARKDHMKKHGKKDRHHGRWKKPRDREEGYGRYKRSGHDSRVTPRAWQSRRRRN